MRVFVKGNKNMSRGTVARKAGKNCGGFTMVEIALSLAVVAFALVAIMGVLPTGMTVQKDTREDTLINQELRYWLEAIKSGARGLDEITNYVESVKVEQTGIRPKTVDFVNEAPELLSPTDIVSLLSLPKYPDGPGGPLTNRVTARVRPITGGAADRAAMRGTTTNNITFRYQIQVEIVSSFPLPGALAGDALAAGDPRPAQFNEGVGQNLWDVRLIARWPVVDRGNTFFVGNGKKTIRARVQGVPQPPPARELSTFVRSEFTNLTVLRPNQFNVQAGIQ
jgi:type II secretory pathway pseudopilin PulG